ncbi:hypothetical protein GCM10010174_35310 [Kutzneria viridogrisea]|uniref:DUF8017 domain-containing protein n=2 Tax=Kutzneria TaxID=43356 RepID=W5W340_9PSEU|nr:hypothetical protein [Kutzneria albida]AHH94926.1 hypothetical protein KALB_1554 [Kutzneria albida DSM 43870]MBA8927742.1 hypothetical protein [Kutzneria viridogrisea]
MTWPTGGQSDSTQPYTGGFGPQGSQGDQPGHGYPGQQQYGYPQYQQQYQYSGLGMYGNQPQQQPPKPPRKTKALAIVLTLVGVLVVGGGVAIALVLSQKSQPTPVANGSSSAAPSTTAPLKPTDPRIAGWQTQVSNTRNVAYDLPKAQWTLRDPDDVLPLGPSTGDFVTGTGGATYMTGYCAGQSGSIRAGIAVTANDKDAPDKSAPATAAHWAKVAYQYSKGQPADITLEPSKTIRVADGATEAVLAVADATLHIDDACFPKTAKVYTAAVKTKQAGSVLLVLFADQGVPGAISEADAVKIMTSMRPAS